MFGITMEQLVNYNSWPDGLEHPLLTDDQILIPPNALVSPTLPAMATTTTSLG